LIYSGQCNDTAESYIVSYRGEASLQRWQLHSNGVNGVEIVSTNALRPSRGLDLVGMRGILVSDYDRRNRADSLVEACSARETREWTEGILDNPAVSCVSSEARATLNWRRV